MSHSYDNKTDTNSDPNFQLKNWPCSHEAAWNACDNMIGNYHVHPIPTYDPMGKPIHPTQYEQSLKGALAIIHFTLKSWSFNAYDTTNADIMNIWVLILPTNPQLLQKRKCPKTDPFKTGSTQSHPKKTHTTHNWRDPTPMYLTCILTVASKTAPMFACFLKIWVLWLNNWIIF